MGAAGILKGPRSPAGATGGHVAVTLRRKPLGRWSWSVGLRRTGIREEGTGCVDLQGRCVGGALAAVGHDHTGGPASWDGQCGCGAGGEHASPSGALLRAGEARAQGPAGREPGLGAAAVRGEAVSRPILTEPPLASGSGLSWAARWPVPQGCRGRAPQHVLSGLLLCLRPVQ